MLNRSKPFGKVCPPEHGVAYIQDGRYFNGQFHEVSKDGKLIEPSVEVSEPAPPKAVAATTGSMEVGALLALAPKLPFGTFKKLAQEHLGDKCPSLKADIIRSLEVLQGPPRAAQAAPAVPPRGEPQPSKDGDKKTVASNGVDLVAWGDKRINQAYLMGDVISAIRELHSKVVNNERDAINFLVDEGVVEAQFARVATQALSRDVPSDEASA